MNFNFRPAVRDSVVPLIGLSGPSGSGKTFSSLLLARGIVGPEGKIAVIDTERGRASLYADQIPGGYQILDLEPPYTPERYIEALRATESCEFDLVIIDSGSHEWEGEGGVLDMAAERETKSKKAGLHNWKEPKRQHSLFVNALLRSSIPVIVNMRAKYKSKQVRENGRTVIVKDDFTSPIQADDFIFEMTIHGEVMPDHSFRSSKNSHPDLVACFNDGEAITIQTGEAIAEWCRGESKRPAVEILDEARSAANDGKDAFNSWWKEQDKHARAIAKTIWGELETKINKSAEEEEIPT